MNATTRKALEASIRHWERMRDGKRRMVGPRNNQGVEVPEAPDCALCRRFRGDDCVGCPVADSTGVTHCDNTPYDAADTAWDAYGIESRQFILAADREVEFLRGLLP